MIDYSNFMIVPSSSRFLTLLVLLYTTVLGQAQQLSHVKVEGNKFVNEEGKVLVFRGLNTSDPDKLERDGHWNMAYFSEMKNWGADIVRIPVHPGAWRSRGKDNYIKLLDEGIAWATKEKMYVIIDWHSIGNLESELFYQPRYETTKKETFEFWSTMAQHFAGNNTVAFFELFNEPTTYNGKLGTCSWAQWKDTMEEAIIVIRANGGTAIPLVAGFNWGYDLTPIIKNPIQAEDIGYVSHPYPQKREKPWIENWEKDWAFAKAHYPLILTEMGFCGADDRGAHVPVIGDETYGDTITKFCKEKGISYTVWVFDPDWSPMLFSDWDFTPSRQGKYFKAALQQQ